MQYQSRLRNALAEARKVCSNYVVLNTLHSLIYIRKLEDEELAHCLQQDKLRFSHRVCAPAQKQKQSMEITKIAAYQLKFTVLESLGEGSFGKCRAATYNEHEVCVKIMKRGVMDEAHLLQEGGLLTKLDHQHIPHCFGVCRSKLMLVMSLHTVEGKPMALDAAMTVCGPVMENRNGIKYLYQVSTALTYIHEQGYVHNDIKGNNIILDDRQTTDIQAILIDFGKACHHNKGKRYKLTEEEQQQYIAHHPQIAPDLRDGREAQNVKTDIFALGRLIEKMCKMYSMLGETYRVATCCLADASQDRPELKEVSQALQQVIEVHD